MLKRAVVEPMAKGDELPTDSTPAKVEVAEVDEALMNGVSTKSEAERPRAWMSPL